MYRIQVLLTWNDGTKEWRDIHPAGHPDKPYRYETREKAEDMLRICYGAPLVGPVEARVIEEDQ